MSSRGPDVTRRASPSRLQSGRVPSPTALGSRHFRWCSSHFLSRQRIPRAGEVQFPLVTNSLVLPPRCGRGRRALTTGTAVPPGSVCAAVTSARSQSRCRPPSPLTGALGEPGSAMSSEESYRAILRYLTNECEPYAPGTEGNVKRKIRKAAACYVVRDGTLYYQRRQRHRKTFAELEVVLQPERRWGLIEAAHLGPGGTHHTQHQTWHDLSKTYWWRGFCKASFLPLLEFAYTSVLSFDFCSMADVAILARHLFMSEVLEICESVHKLMEEKQLTVYKKGEVQTVASTQDLPEQNGGIAPPVVNNEGTTTTLPTDLGDCEIVLLVNGEVPGTEQHGELRQQPEPQVSAEAEAPLSPSPAGCATDSHPEMDSVDLVTKNNQTELETSNSREGSTVSNIYPKLSKENVISGPPENSDMGNDTSNEDICDEDMPEHRQNLGQSLKDQENLVAKTDLSPDDDTYRSRLRQRSINEGGYIRLHKGMEKKLQKRKATPKSAVQQVAQKLVQRGKKMKQPKRDAKENTEEEASHKCGECGMVFQRRYTLIMHTLKHERSRDYKCPLCKKQFQYSASLRAHLIRHTRKVAPSSSSSNFTSNEASGTSSEKGRTKREFICSICGRTLPKLYSLRIHMLKHTGVKPHACQVCGKTFIYKHGLKLHQSLHQSQKQFQCELCVKSFVTKRSLQEHMSIHTGESKYHCSVCGKSFHRGSGLSKHQKKHQPKPEVRGYHCTQCEKSFFEARDLRQHMNKHLGVKPFQCQYCDKCYSWKKDWYSHVKSHSVTEPYRCNICGKEFYEKALFRRHVKKATHGKKGRAKQNLERVCERCGRKFTQLREYRRHMNNHEGVKPFECLTCGVAWADARSLKRHVRTHTGERPYVCPVCSEAYIDARTLRKHMTKFHRDYVPCKIMLEKDTLQFHNQGTQVEHAVSIVTADIHEQESSGPQELETVVVTGETVEALEAVAAAEEYPSVSTLSDQSIMQVVNYVLAQQQGQKLSEVAEAIQTVEVEVAHISEAEGI
ncbi:zinc finger and BTB domain-containing protein 11 isoform X3 [Myotis daubentonii]|uniref:zinc finger and BTB domain-containing protein 11 isoform X3 n=1 Tax=Myotis daubentonii TaxID=98922 RepID=UPI0028731BC6|nr:zinc finger and BTB domain-containing protein 11 isoform X3 [Myotis daubentonii]